MSKARRMTQELLLQILRYEPETGKFLWLVRPSSKRRIGDQAGHLEKALGYVVVRFQGTSYMAHRLAWLYVHGRWPDGLIDHKNGDRADNRFDNLRDVAHRVNMQNLRKAFVSSKTGLLGASPLKDGRFGAFIKRDGKSKNLGTFDTPELAHAAYVAAKRVIHHEGNTL